MDFNIWLDRLFRVKVVMMKVGAVPLDLDILDDLVDLASLAF